MLYTLDFAYYYIVLLFVLHIKKYIVVEFETMNFLFIYLTNPIMKRWY